MTQTPKLSDIEVQRELGHLTGWMRKGESLVKTFTFPTFPAGISFVDRVAAAAQAMDHHPDMDIRFTKISATLSTHSSGGITASDIALAKEMDRLAK